MLLLPEFCLRICHRLLHDKLIPVDTFPIVDRNDKRASALFIGFDRYGRIHGSNERIQLGTARSFPCWCCGRWCYGGGDLSGLRRRGYGLIIALTSAIDRANDDEYQEDGDDNNPELFA